MLPNLFLQIILILKKNSMTLQIRFNPHKIVKKTFVLIFFFTYEFKYLLIIKTLEIICLAPWEIKTF